jgi:hypothetical protein
MISPATLQRLRDGWSRRHWSRADVTAARSRLAAARPDRLAVIRLEGHFIAASLLAPDVPDGAIVAGNPERATRRR